MGKVYLFKEATVYTLNQANLPGFLGMLTKGRDVFALEKDGLRHHLVGCDHWDASRHTLGAFRPVEPLKALVFPPREFVGTLDGETPDSGTRERIVIGVKNCDLSALRIHDHVFLKTEPVDPFYARAREKTIVVSCDCTDALEVCFCPIVDEQPYPKSGYDINLSPTSLGIVVESGTERGKRLLEEASPLLKPADDVIVAERDRKRAELTQRICEQAEAKGLKRGSDLQAAIRDTEEEDFWDGFARDCVECGACNFVCCTCHCFVLADGRGQDNTPARVKKWDSCLYRNFARVAGGANPRGHRAERLYNRFDKKFCFFPEVLGTYACDGCGRCAEACTGKIDIREVLKRALDGR